jgi:hypothetical protein
MKLGMVLALTGSWTFVSASVVLMALTAFGITIR